MNSVMTFVVNGAVAYDMLGNIEAACNLLCTQWGTPHPVMHLVLLTNFVVTFF